ncbi:MAG: HNH endonuclease signature motif containing protein [bacterium]
MELHKLVESIIIQLSKLDQSRNWKGELNWQWLGATDRCWRCGKVAGEEVEIGALERHHIIPRSEGGLDTDDNNSLLCGNCHNVVHRRHMGVIGSKQTRDKEWRSVLKSKSVCISQKMPDIKHALGKCTKCGSAGKIIGVSEGYWTNKGMVVFLECEDCRHLFAIPFLDTTALDSYD